MQSTLLWLVTQQRSHHRNSIPPSCSPSSPQAHVLEIIEKLFSDRTCFTIAHR